MFNLINFSQDQILQVRRAIGTHAGFARSIIANSIMGIQITASDNQKFLDAIILINDQLAVGTQRVISAQDVIDLHEAVNREMMVRSMSHLFDADASPYNAINRKP